MLSEIKKKLQEYSVSYTDIYTCDDNIVEIEINRGDWKHDHLCCIQLMRELGYVLLGEHYIFEDGSDCYTSTHRYKKYD